MTYKEILADVRRLFRRIRKERKKVLESKKLEWVNKKYDVEIEKIKRMTGTKRAFSLGKGKRKSDLLTILEELETFIKTPNITENSREERHSKRIKEFMHNWQLTSGEAENFFDIMNTDEVRELIELNILDSDQVMEVARNANNSRSAIIKLANISSTEKELLSEMPISERAEWLENLLRGIR